MRAAGVRRRNAARLARARCRVPAGLRQVDVEHLQLVLRQADQFVDGGGLRRDGVEAGFAGSRARGWFQATWRNPWLYPS